MTTLQTTDGAPAAVALLGATGAIERATTLFLDRYGTGDEPLAANQAELDDVLGGRLDRASVTLDDLAGELLAVVGPDGRRHALLTISAIRAAVEERPNPLLADAIDESPIDDSPAIVWLKDLDGHYLRVSRSFSEQLGVDSDHICGKTDAELSAKESIEGLRLRVNDPVPQEPLELEYTVAAFEDRPAYAVLRFALRDNDGKPIAVCGVAAPLSQARTARAECERLMRIERWSRLDDRTIREELLDEWELTPADRVADVAASRAASDPIPGDAASEVAALAAERDAAIATAARLDQQLAEERQEVASLVDASRQAARRAEELSDVVEAEQARTEELERALAQAEIRLEELTRELETERWASERSGADAEQALGAERETIEALREELDAARFELERVRVEELEAERRAADALRAELRAAHQETEQARLAAAEVAKQAPRQEDVDLAKDQLSQVLAELAEANDELERAKADAAASAGTLAAEWETKEALQAELIAARDELERAGRELERASQELKERGHELERTREELERARGHVAESPTHGDLAELRTRSERAEDRAADAEARAAQAEAQLVDAQARVAEAQARADDAEARIEQAEARARDAEAAAAAAQEYAQAAEEHAHEAEEHAHEADARAREAQAEAEGARADAAASLAELEQERGMIDSLRQELQRANADAATASAALTVEREMIEALHGELTAARSELEAHQDRVAQAEHEMAEAGVRAAEEAARAQTELEVMRQTVDELSGELSAARAELDQLRAQLPPAGEEAAESEDGEPAAARHTWTTASQRALSAALAGAADWRGALKQAARVIGTEGGWDAVVAWAPDDGRGPMTCSAMWTSDPARLAGFENLTWQHRLDASGTEFGRARNRPGPTCLLELQTAEDRMLRMAAEVGMGSALLLPIREGEKTIAILELLSSAASPPDSELMVALEAVALQLSGVGQALNTTHWNLGGRL